MTDAVDTAAHAMGFMLADMLNSDGPIDMDALSRAALTAVLDAVTLEWRDTPNWKKTGVGEMHSTSGKCRVWTNQTGRWFWRCEDSGGRAETKAAAQAAALADYRARLARALGMEEG